MCEHAGTASLTGRLPQPGAALAAGAAPPAKKTRRKLWELPENLHCPVIGTCLEVNELRQIARRCGYAYQAPPTDYDLHVSFVSLAQHRNALSLAAHKALDKRYAGTIRRYARARSATELGVLWSQALARGDVPGALWAIVTHPRQDAELLRRVREQVHMLSHQIGAGQRADLQRLTEAEAELQTLRHDFDQLLQRSRLQLDERERRICELETANQEAAMVQHRLAAREQTLRSRLDALQAMAPPTRLATLQRQCSDLTRRLQLAEQQRDALRAECAAAQAHAAALAKACHERQAECAALEKLVGPTGAAACRDCERPDCAGCADLCGRRVLCVGGRNQLLEQYRAVVAQCNGRFEHHDGGIEDHRQRLEVMLASADAVVCATDCVSHDAYYRTKRFCKRHAKPYVLLRNSGVSAFVRAVEQLGTAD